MTEHTLLYPKIYQRPWEESRMNRGFRTNEELKERFIEICSEQGLRQSLEIEEPTRTGIDYTLRPTSSKDGTYPHLKLTHENNQPTAKIKIYNGLKSFRRQIKLEKPEKYRNIIEQSIEVLNQQYEDIRSTNEAIQELVQKLEVGGQPKYTRRVNTTWHVSYGTGDNVHSIVIQYDFNSNEYLLQKRYTNPESIESMLRNVTI